MGKSDTDKSMLLATILKLRAVYPSLRAAEQRAVDYIVEHPDEVVYLSVTELAERSGTSESTVVRMCQQAGYRGYQELKIAIAQDLVAPIKNIHEDVNEDDDTATVMHKVFAANIQALENTRAVLDIKELDRATTAIVGAERVIVLGVGTSGPIVHDCQYKLMRLGLHCQAFVDPHIQLLQLAQMGPSDVAIGISHSGSSREVVEAMASAKDLGLTTICITGYPKSPITQWAEICLFTSATETKFRTEAIASRVAQWTIVDTLYVNVALRMKERALTQIRRTEELILGRKY
ncbi:MAG: MurR/RpiR family transcriptional regulator [Firmicutes bacterium]|nr:MurR/RpiR family transcriptional regulator [Bacillota bacterium]